MKKETLAQVFSCTFYDISKNTYFTYFTEHLLVTATEFHKQLTNLHYTRLRKRRPWSTINGMKIHEKLSNLLNQ